jgi:leucyl/phenylalanyl-tRNA--protein transferase
MTDEIVELTPDMLLAAYANGYFPMAMEADDPELYWFSPEERGVMPIAGFNIPRGLKRAMKKHNYTVTVDTCFEEVIRGCATVSKGRSETWINEKIIELYTALAARGQAHSIEVWQSLIGSGCSPDQPSRSSGLARPARSFILPPFEESCVAEGEPRSVGGLGVQPPCNKKLIGGLYGVSLGGAFFGESMFSRAPDASKIALVMLVEILGEAGYELLDTQYVNEHLKQFGVEAVSKKSYMTKLEKALSASPNPSSLFSTVSVRKGLASSSSVSRTSAS